MRFSQYFVKIAKISTTFLKNISRPGRIASDRDGAQIQRPVLCAQLAELVLAEPGVAGEEELPIRTLHQPAAPKALKIFFKKKIKNFSYIIF